MSRRLLIISIALAVLIIPAIIVLFLVDRNPSLQNAVEKIANTNSANVEVINTNLNTNQAEDPDAVAIRYVARNFTEEYGNESNQNNFANLEASKNWGTSNFNSFLDRTISQGRINQTITPYHALTTKVIVISITNQTSGNAAVTVDTQRVETTGTDETVKTQKLFLDLVKQSDEWKINAASWEAT